jgi:hypothetical protein
LPKRRNAPTPGSRSSREPLICCVERLREPLGGCVNPLDAVRCMRKGAIPYNLQTPRSGVEPSGASSSCDT